MKHPGSTDFSLEKRLTRREPIWEDRWVHAVAARTRGSMIPFDTFDRRRLGREFSMMDRSVHAAAADHIAVQQVVETPTRLWPLRESRSRLFASVYRQLESLRDHSRTQLERSSLLINSQTRSLSPHG